MGKGPNVEQTQTMWLSLSSAFFGARGHLGGMKYGCVASKKISPQFTVRSSRSNLAWNPRLLLEMNKSDP